MPYPAERQPPADYAESAPSWPAASPGYPGAPAYPGYPAPGPGQPDYHVAPAPAPFGWPAPFVARAPGSLAPFGYSLPLTPAPVVLSCPACRYQGPPRFLSRISPAGWTVFVVLLLACLPLFWIGLLVKETVALCPHCSAQFPVRT